MVVLIRENEDSWVAYILVAVSALGAEDIWAAENKWVAVSARGVRIFGRQFYLGCLRILRVAFLARRCVGGSFSWG